MDDSIRYVDDVFSTDRPGIGINLVYMFLEGILFFILTLLIEVSFIFTYTYLFIPHYRAVDISCIIIIINPCTYLDSLLDAELEFTCLSS